MACNHPDVTKKIIPPKLGYIAWFDWADKQIEIGNKQILCKDCNRYVWVSTSKNTSRRVEKKI